MAGAIALRRYIAAQQDAGFSVRVAPEDRTIEPTPLPHIDAYVRAFHEAEGWEEVDSL